MHGLEITDLHGRCAAEDIGGLAHQLGRFDFGARGDDLGFSGSLALCRHRQGVLQLLAEDDVLDQHALDLNTPARRDLFDDVADILSNLLATFNHVLQDARTDDMTEGGLGTFNERLTDVANAEGSAMRRGDAVVDDGCEPQRDIVLGHADLLGHFDELDLNVDLDQTLRKRVDLDETRVDGASEAAEPGDETDITLVDWLVWVRAADTAWECAAGTDDITQDADEAAVPTVGARVLLIGVNDPSVRCLQVFALWRLDCKRVRVDFVIIFIERTLDHGIHAIDVATAALERCFAAGVHCFDVKKWL